MLMIMIIGIVGCSKPKETTKEGDKKEEGDNSIELTMDDYEKYLNVKVSTGTTGQGYKLDGLADPYYNQVLSVIEVEGVLPNYNYEGVEVEAKIYVKYEPIKRM